MRKVLGSIVSGALLLAVAAPSAQAQFGTEPSELDLVKLADDLYVIHNAYVPGNTTVLVTDDGVLLIDNKFPIDFPNVSAMIASITDKPVKYVINTHHHADHSGANANFQELSAVAIASEQARSRMLAANQAGLPDVTIAERGHVYLGGVEVQMYWLGRGHTDGDIVVLLPRHRVLVSGDLYANDPGTPELIDYSGGGSAVEWTGTLDKVLELDFDTVIPGHGTTASKAALEEFRESSARLSEMVSEMVEQGRTRAAIEQVMRNEFGWQDFHVNMGLDGLIDEMR